MTDEPDEKATNEAIARADRVRFVRQLRAAFSDECDRPTISQEEGRVRDCLEAGVPPYGEL